MAKSFFRIAFGGAMAARQRRADRHVRAVLRSLDEKKRAALDASGEEPYRAED